MAAHPVFGRYWMLLILAAACFVAGGLLERWAKRTMVRLSDEEYAARVAAAWHGPPSRFDYTPAGAIAYKRGGWLLYGCLALIGAWLLLN